MQPQTNRLEYLRKILAELSDDSALPWDAYPCIEWPFGRDKRGRGRVWIDGNTRDVRHTAFVLSNGPIPDKHYLEKHCFNASCFRPHHSYVAIYQVEYLRRSVEETRNETGDWRDYPCLLWPYILNAHGYGFLMKNEQWVRVHRESYRLGRDDFDESLHVLHHCDTPACHRLIHLFQGDQNDNNQDKLSKDRQPRGETNGGAIITEADVREIFRLSRSGVSQSEIARRIGFKSSVSVLQILRRNTWAHVKID